MISESVGTLGAVCRTCQQRVGSIIAPCRNYSKHHMRAIFALFMLVASVAHAGVLPLELRSNLAQRALTVFWGNARDSSGSPIVPRDNRDRMTYPVTPKVMQQVIDAGELSGLAQWCQLDWEPRYFALTRAARNEKFSDKQVAFVSFLHGMTQEAIFSAMERKACSLSARSKVKEALCRSPLLRQ